MCVCEVLFWSVGMWIIIAKLGNWMCLGSFSPSKTWQPLCEMASKDITDSVFRLSSGPGEKPSDVRRAGGGGGLKGADQRALREELCAGAGECRVEVPGQQRAALAASRPVRGCFDRPGADGAAASVSALAARPAAGGRASA